jgi:hypothetical protein
MVKKSAWIVTSFKLTSTEPLASIILLPSTYFKRSALILTGISWANKGERQNNKRIDNVMQNLNIRV